MCLFPLDFKWQLQIKKNLYCKYALPLGFRRQVIPSTERLNIIACTGCNLIQKHITWFTGLTYLVSAAHE